MITSWLKPIFKNPVKKIGYINAKIHNITIKISFLQTRYHESNQKNCTYRPFGALVMAQVQYDLKWDMNRNYKYVSGTAIFIPLQSQGSVGRVRYTVSGLPGTLRYDAALNSIVGSAPLTSGNYPILIKGED